MSVKEKQALAKFKADEFFGGFDTVSVMNNPLLFWDSQHTRKEYRQYPELRIIALRILSIPLGEVSCERLFSALKSLVDSKPTKLFSEACLWFMGSQGPSKFCA